MAVGVGVKRLALILSMRHVLYRSNCSLQSTPNLPTNIVPTKIAWLKLSVNPLWDWEFLPLKLTFAWVKPSEIHNVRREIGRISISVTNYPSERQRRQVLGASPPNVIYVYIYIYIYREREREREIHNKIILCTIYIYIYISLSVYIDTYNAIYMFIYICVYIYIERERDTHTHTAYT